MNHIKKMIVCIALITSIKSLFAENKDVVYVVNNFGEEVSVSLKWSPKPHSYSYTDKNEDFLMYEDDRYDDGLEEEVFNAQFEHKAPFSKYYLSEISVASVASKMERMTSVSLNSPHGGGYSYTPPQSLNEMKFKFTKPLSPNLFFVIEVDEQKSRMSGKKKIKISRFLSRDAYRKELAKTNPGLLVQKMQPVQSVQPMQSFERASWSQPLPVQLPQPAQIFTQRPDLQQAYNLASNQQYRHELIQDQEFGGIDFSGFGG